MVKPIYPILGRGGNFNIIKTPEALKNIKSFNLNVTECYSST
jgi:hypothetical protein